MCTSKPISTKRKPGRPRKFEKYASDLIWAWWLSGYSVKYICEATCTYPQLIRSIILRYNPKPDDYAIREVTKETKTTEKQRALLAQAILSDINNGTTTEISKWLNSRKNKNTPELQPSTKLSKIVLGITNLKTKLINWIFKDDVK